MTEPFAAIGIIPRNLLEGLRKRIKLTKEFVVNLEDGSSYGSDLI